MGFIRTYWNSEDRHMSTSIHMMNTEDGAQNAPWVSDAFNSWRSRCKVAFPSAMPAQLLPSNITGIAVFNMQQNLFEFKPGPVLWNIIIA